VRANAAGQSIADSIARQPAGMIYYHVHIPSFCVVCCFHFFSLADLELVMVAQDARIPDDEGTVGHSLGYSTVCCGITTCITTCITCVCGND